MSEIRTALTAEQRAEHLSFLEQIVGNHRAHILLLTPPTHWPALEGVLRDFEMAIQTREEFRLWGQAAPPE